MSRPVETELKLGRTTYRLQAGRRWHGIGPLGEARKVMVSRPYPHVESADTGLIGAIIRRGRGYVAAHYRDLELARAVPARTQQAAIEALATLLADMRMEALAAARGERR